MSHIELSLIFVSDKPLLQLIIAQPITLHIFLYNSIHAQIQDASIHQPTHAITHPPIYPPNQKSIHPSIHPGIQYLKFSYDCLLPRRYLFTLDVTYKVKKEHPVFKTRPSACDTESAATVSRIST
jgi:hypothetical protein